MKKMDEIQRDINWIIQYLMKKDEPIQPPPYMPNEPVKLMPTICNKCGMKFWGTTGYRCPNSDCPIFIKTTC